MLQVITVPAFTDNYIWLLSNQNKKYAAIVDPGEAQPVIDALMQHDMQAIAILITHHHPDHVGGIEELLSHYPNIPVYGPASELIPHITYALDANTHITLDKLGLSFDILDIPGHTSGHIAYYHKSDRQGSLFCGDTLFANGCGRIFDGTLHDLHDSLQQIAQLPEDTQIYCAHEYTLDNIGFAKWVEPDNEELQLRQEQSWKLIDQQHATVPFTLALELKTNPFLRTHAPTVIAKAEEIAGQTLHSSLDVFTVLRIWKDTEYD
jgi:hydroxyacylglutathione hydrolase